MNKNISEINILTPEDTKEEMRRSVLGEKRKFDFQHRLFNGDVRDVEVYSSPVYLNEKPYLYSIIHDVTERRRIEKALHDNEEKFREIFDHANDAIHLHVFTESGAPGCFIDVNEVACRMLGYTHEEMIQIPPLDLSTDYHDPPMDNVLEELRLKGRARFETEHRRKDGSIVPVEINAHVVNHEGIKMTISVVRDISENKRIMSALKLASEKLNLLSSITRHDINNQTVAIKGHLELLKLKHPELEFDEHLRTIEREAGQISSMIRFTKEYEDIGVHAPIWQNVRRLVELVSKDILLQGVKVVDDIPEGTAIFADPLTVKVFRNLIQNALRHGEGVTTIHFFIEERDGDLPSSVRTMEMASGRYEG